MDKMALISFLKKQIQDAKDHKVLFSVHMKATMMKVSDPIIFGHVVSTFFEDVFAKHRAVLNAIGYNPNNGLEVLYAKLEKLPSDQAQPILDDLEKALENGPDLAW